MSDVEEDRKIASNWREYLRDTRESLRAFTWVWRELINPKSRLWTKRALAIVAMQMLLTSIMPFALAAVIDGLVTHNGHRVVVSLGFYFGCHLTARLLAFGWNSAIEIVAGENMVCIDSRTSRLFLGKSLGQHMRDDGTLTAANVEKGRGRSHEIVNQIVFDGIPTLMELLIGFTLLFVMAPVAGAIMTTVLVTYLLWLVFLNRRVIAVCTPIDAEFRAINRYRVERWDSVERVKTSGKEDEELRIMDRRYEATLRKDRSFWLWFHRMASLRGLFNVFGAFLVLAYCSWKVWSGVWTVGLFWPIYRWTSQVSDNLWKIGQIEHSLNVKLPSVQSMRAALTTPTDIVSKPDAVILPDAPVCVELEMVTHRYPSDSKAATSGGVLTDVSFSIEPGEKVALIGESGAGKTTVMRLLQRYFDPKSGAVRVNGSDLRDVDLDSWRALLAYIPQQAHVFDGTLRSNLLYGLPEERQKDVSDEAIWALMRTLRIDFGERLTDGLDTVVGRRGIKLSGGQAQRLMIGSAIIKRPRFLIIDEATSSLDSTTEREVQQGIERVLETSTSALIITHRLPTVRKLCTKFVVLKPVEKLAPGENQVEAVASSFEELYKLSPTFRRLADDQGVTINASPIRVIPRSLNAEIL